MDNQHYSDLVIKRTYRGSLQMFPAMSSNSGSQWRSCECERSPGLAVDFSWFFREKIPSQDSQGRWCCPSCRSQAQDLVSCHGCFCRRCPWNNVKQIGFAHMMPMNHDENQVQICSIMFSLLNLTISNHISTYLWWFHSAPRLRDLFGPILTSTIEVTAWGMPPSCGWCACFA